MSPMINDHWENIEGNGFNCRILISLYNKRITVYDHHLDGGGNKVENPGITEMVNMLTSKAMQHNLDKVWLKTTPKWAGGFQQAGLKQEAVVPGFFKGKETANILSLFLSNKRETPSTNKGPNWDLTAFTPKDNAAAPRARGITFRWGQKEHSKALAGLYAKIFATYPFPVSNPAYIAHTMDHGVRYVTAWHSQNLVAAAAAETDHHLQNAELTDFATSPTYRNQGLAQHCLRQLEKYLKEEKYRCLYTMARRSSIGMNKSFQSCGYTYNGVLLKNCNIAGKFEDMNVWSKII